MPRTSVSLLREVALGATVAQAIWAAGLVLGSVLDIFAASGAPRAE